MARALMSIAMEQPVTKTVFTTCPSLERISIHAFERNAGSAMVTSVLAGLGAIMSASLPVLGVTPPVCHVGAAMNTGNPKVDAVPGAS